MAGQADWWLLMASERSETAIDRYVSEVQRLFRWGGWLGAKQGTARLSHVDGQDLGRRAGEQFIRSLPLPPPVPAFKLLLHSSQLHAGWVTA